jgi:hypothetical protein
MKKKLFAAAALLGIALVPSFTPQADAIAYCSPSYCAGKLPTAKCACPPGTDRVGQPSSCGAYNGPATAGCWYV